jgi:hypothetical protein
MGTTKRYPEEVRERAVRLVRKLQVEHGSQWAGEIPPAEFEHAYYRRNENHAMVA